ncbi:MAG: tRNA uridine-5-carboxymethylaminomethyl(34) synthesis enzyme MnmG [Puniceicoccaceae bacterium]
MNLALRFGPQQPYDVIVCGAGHAGCEAALAAARMGAHTLILTGNLDTVAQMSCNPAIGGLAKGNIVREIDAMGGEMGVNTDLTAIQFKLLNASKGPSVRGPRAQCDKKAYQFRMKQVLEKSENLTVFQAMVVGLIFENDAVIGVETNIGVAFHAKTVVVTTGTFLRGLMHIGDNRNKGGRLGDFSAETLSDSFLRAGIELERLKTGTPPRIVERSINFSGLEEQAGDDNPTLFAFWDTRKPEGEMFHVEQMNLKGHGWIPNSVRRSCWMTETSERTSEIIRANLHRSPLYGGIIEGTGPRYCPSIEDKVVRFADKPTHKVYLEPEGATSEEWYINGLSTSLPFDVQCDLLRSIRGLEDVQILRPAYAVEYDFAPPTQLLPSLESKKVEGLFFAGQINGTSGYEEAAGQGLIAGANAAAKVLGVPSLILRRDQAYLGVLIDDLVTKGTKEPYRMFTSRAEYRLLLNHGSSEYRLYPSIADRNLVPADRLKRIRAKIDDTEAMVKLLETRKGRGGTLADMIRRNESIEGIDATYDHASPEVREEAHFRIYYQGYIDREQRTIRKMEELEAVRIPNGFDFNQVRGLRSESREKLQKVRPLNLGQANRISGVNPADISILMVTLAKGSSSR